MKTGIIFPAFVNEYSGHESVTLSNLNNNFKKYLKEASEALGVDLNSFDFQTNTFLDNELKSQYISYIFSCTIADILCQNHVRPAYVSGYSMGIYASLYYCGSVTFLEGLYLIKTAWEIISVKTSDNKFGMGMIVGLSNDDISNILKNHKGVFICNQNNSHTFIISGLADSIEKVLAEAKIEGALRNSFLPVSKPYHSNFLDDVIPEFKQFVNSISFSEPIFKYVSAMNQKIIDTAEGFKNEVIENINCKMNWNKTVNFIVNQNTSVLFECGAGNGLTRNSKFIPGDYSMFHIGKLREFLKRK